MNIVHNNFVSTTQERLEATTKVYFKSGDFSNTGDLDGLFHEMNAVTCEDKLTHG